MSDPVIESLIEHFRSRSDAGFQKYGRHLSRTDINLQGWQTHLLEELMDACAYLTRIQQEADQRERDFETFQEGMLLASQRFRGRDLEQEQARLARVLMDAAK